MTETRLTLARMYRGWTKKRLAEEVGVTPAAITKFENGTSKPSDSTLRAIACKLEFPVSYFSLAEVDLPEASAISFRARRKMSGRQRDQAISASAFGITLSDWMDDNFNLPEVDIPDLSDMTPENAALTIRSLWGLGERPIPDMITLLEMHGVRVFSIQEASPKVDAYSFWDEQRNKPFVFLTTSKSGERRRMDAGHELGHLVLHRKTDLDIETRIIEQEANTFASALLMPRSGFLSTSPRGGSLSDYLKVKRYWKVSLAATVYRAHSLGLLTDWQYRTLFKSLNSRDMRNNEPQPIFPEKSQIATKILQLEKDEHGGLEYLTSMTGIPEAMITAITFQYPGNVIDGDGGIINRSNQPQNRRASLRIV